MEIDQVLNKVHKQDYQEKEFLQAVEEVFDSIKILADHHPEYAKKGIYERIVEPERMIIFRVPWVDDQGEVHVNRGYRVQFNSALGPYKGGLRFHPNVNLSIIKFLGFEQIFKNALTGLLMGGAKGGSDFDPKNKSADEIMRFCQSFMNELYRHIGPHTDIPAGDIGVDARAIAYLFGQYKKLSASYSGAITGKGVDFGGSLIRKEATGYGLCYFMKAYLADHNEGFKDKKVIITGSGNVALYAMAKALSFGAKVVAMSDSDGYVYAKEGLNFEDMRHLKEDLKGRIKTYALEHPGCAYVAGFENIFDIKADIILLCATQNEVDENIARKIIANGTLAVGEGANMPCRLEAVKLLREHGVLFAPAKAANAGGVAVSGLEMSQNATFVPWSAETVDAKLQQIMVDIYQKAKDCAAYYNLGGNLLAGANIYAFRRVADAMLAQGIV